MVLAGIKIILTSMIDVVFQFWPAIISVLLISGISCAAGEPLLKELRLITGIAIIVSGVAGLLTSLYHASDPQHNLLVRDIVAFSLISLAAPVLTDRTARLLVRSITFIRFIVPAFAGLLLLSTSPLILLLVHCSSGDCL